MSELAVTPQLTEGERLAKAILTRKLRKCIAEGAHIVHAPQDTDHSTCPRCGL